jgi:hypothetical protein
MVCKTLQLDLNLESNCLDKWGGPRVGIVPPDLVLMHMLAKSDASLSVNMVVRDKGSLDGIKLCARVR